MKISEYHKIPFKGFKTIPFWLSLFTLLIVIYDLGFEQTHAIQFAIDKAYLVTLIVAILATVSRHLRKTENPFIRILLFDFFSVLFFSFIVAVHLHFIPESSPVSFLNAKSWTVTAIFLTFIREFSAVQLDIKRTVLNPAQLFIISFLSIIILGGFLLLLPRATVSGISLIDALFTSTSAVCVTGLTVMDTGTQFTVLGQTIILILIQVGGLGIMTFASYFSYFFKGGSSFENQLILSDITSSKKIGEVFTVLKKILLVTFYIESLGAVLIYLTLEESFSESITEKVFFSIFHSISAFCNAGFSTLPNSLYEQAFRFNYPMHLIIASLFIIGGIGFPIVFNLYRVTKQIVVGRIYALLNIKEYTYTPWLINLNSRIVLITSLILTLSGTVLFYFYEQNNTLAEHHGIGKWITAFFGATTPRTAGFNTVNTASLHFSTIMFIFLLMWIGASPISTGGGIKTSTFAIATMNFISLAKGKNRIEVFRREIADISVRRAFAIISLSLIVIGMSIFLIAFFDSEKDLMSIAFESFSAYSTVGLSLGITAGLSSISKLIIMVVMFIGRVSMLTLLIALVAKVKHKAYQYPGEEIIIN